MTDNKLIISKDEETMLQSAITSGFLPSSIKNLNQAKAIVQRGRECGITPFRALSEIHVIQGKPTESAKLILSQVRKKYPIHVSYPDFSEEKVTVEIKHKELGEIRVTWTMDMAKKAGLTGKDNWKKHPRNMLTARAVSEACRALFPDALDGAGYSYEELIEIDEPKPRVVTPEVTVEVDPSEELFTGTEEQRDQANAWVNDLPNKLTQEQLKEIASRINNEPMSKVKAIIEGYSS